MAERITVAVELHASRLLAVLLLCLHALAATSALLLDIPLAARGALFAGTGFAGVMAARRHAMLLGDDACVYFRLADDGDCRWRQRDGIERTGSLQAPWFASPLLTVLRFQSAHSRPTTVLVTNGKADPEAFRRLRVLTQCRL